MLPARREFHTTQNTADILSYFPAWMKLHQSDSVAYKYVDAIVGNELELLTDTLHIYQDYNSIVNSPIDSMTSVGQIELPYFLKSTTITANNGVIPISVVQNSQEFLTNPPTRYSFLYNVSPSGLAGSNIVGIEWLDGFPTGQLVVKRDGNEITASSILYYDISTVTNTINTIPTSGYSMGIGYVGLGQNALFESGVIQTAWNLKQQYPLETYLTASGTLSDTMPSGILWDKQSYINPDTGLKTYFNLALNNPYGSGVYDQYDIVLNNYPISGTLVLVDVFNLVSGVPTVIPSSGLNVYGFTSGHYDYLIGNPDIGIVWQQDSWSYKGFENPVPWDMLPVDYQASQIAVGMSGIGPTAIVIGNVSWRFLPSGGYVDDEVYPHNGTFNWIDGSGGLSNTIRISGGFSKYDIQYAYQQFNNITQISADPKQQYHAASPSGGSMYFITGTQFFTYIAFEQSESNSNAVRIDPLVLRPGSNVYYTLTMNKSYKDTWANANTTDKTIQFYNHNIGYTDQLGIRNV